MSATNASTGSRTETLTNTEGFYVIASLLPGIYIVRMTKAGKVSETKLTVGLDRRVKFSEADRKAQFDAAMRVHALFGDESALMDRIILLRGVRVSAR